MPLPPLRHLARASVISFLPKELMRFQKIAVTLCSLPAIFWLGCGGSTVCDKADQASRNLINAAAGCPLFGGGDGGVPVFTVSYNKTACQNALSSCSAADQQSLSKAFDCLSGLNRCVPGQENQFLLSASACVIQASGISS